MHLPLKIAGLAACLALAACGSAEERPFNEQFNSTFSGLENKAAALQAEAENSVSAQEAELDGQARALANRVDAEADLAPGNNVAAAPQR